jgi:hypothetical protein
MSKQWKNVERKIAKFFGAERNPLSGIGSKHTGSDTLHPELFIEAKYREKLPKSLTIIYEGAKREARKEKKIPILCQAERNKSGFYITCHSSYFDDFINVYLKSTSV